MEPLVPLPIIQSIAINPSVRIINGLNPGPFTMQGTNTVLLAADADVSKGILIDSGDADTASIYWEKGLSVAMAESSITEISTVLITHHHHDHVGGISLLRERFPSVQVFKRKLLNSDEACCGSTINEDVEELARPIEEFKSGGGIETLLTPGHTKDHISFLIRLPQSSVILVAGDIILGQGYSPVFEDLKSFMDSLTFLADVCRRENVTILVPGHGPVIEGKEEIVSYVLRLHKHRQDREDQILSVLSLSEGKSLLISEIVKVIYHAYPENLHAAAQNSVLLHMQKLVKEGKVNVAGDDKTNLESSKFSSKL